MLLICTLSLRLSTAFRLAIVLGCMLESTHTGENRWAITRRETNGARHRVGELNVSTRGWVRLSRTSRCWQVKSPSWPNELIQSFAESAGLWGL